MTTSPTFHGDDNLPLPELPSPEIDKLIDEAKHDLAAQRRELRRYRWIRVQRRRRQAAALARGYCRTGLKVLGLIGLISGLVAAALGEFELSAAGFGAAAAAFAGVLVFPPE